MAGGRPSIYSDDLGVEICRRLAMGESLRSICRDEEMPVISTVSLWIVDGKHQWFSERYTKAREAQAIYHVDEMIDHRDDILNGNFDAASARVYMDITKWTSERMARKRFTTKEQEESAGEDSDVTITIKRAKKTDDE